MPQPWSRLLAARRGWAVVPVLVATIAVAVTMSTSGAGLDDRYLTINWQLIDLPVLRNDPLGSVWYLHIQPPLHNLVIGSVLRWSPTPAIGTLFVAYLAGLAVVGLLLSDLLVRWGVPAIVAGLTGAVAVTLPGPLSTIVGGSYEVPVLAIVVTAVWLGQRHLETPRPALLVGVAVVATAAVMTRSMFHPLWAVGVVGLLALARPQPRRVVLAALAVPLLVTGGWMLKNEAVVGEATLSSWAGFNLQRGVVAPMDRDRVDRLVADGSVTPLAQEAPFASLDQYRQADGCVADDRHPALSEPLRAGTPLKVPNHNDTCYLPCSGESRENATTLLRDDPARYLATRRAALTIAFRATPLGLEDPVPTLAGPRQPERTWIDGFWSTALVPAGSTISLAGWNIPLLDLDRLPIDVSLTLVAGYLVVTARGLWAVARLLRAGWRDRATRWPAEEITWVLLLTVVTFAIPVAGLVELGENDRFRATVDPLLIALPLGLAARAVAGRGRRRTAVEPA